MTWTQAALGRIRRNPLLADVAAAVVLAFLALVSMWSPRETSVIDYREPDVLGVVLAVTGAATVVLRSRFPLVALVGALGLTLPLLVLGYSQSIGSAPALLALYSVGSHARSRPSVAGLTVAVAAVAAVLVWGPVEPTLGDWVANALVMSTVWGVGRSVRNRRARQAGQAARDEAVALARESQLRAEALRDMAQIAQEMQDLVAHDLTEITVQLAAARRYIERDPALADSAVAAAEAAGREALTEMRRLLRIMTRTAPDGGVPGSGGFAPMPGLASLDDLVAHRADAGLAVQVRHEGEPRAVPAGAALTVYRTVEEALDNAQRHASATRAEVVLTWEPQQLTVTITDRDGAAPPSWDGPTGSPGGPTSTGSLGRLAERAQVYGGSLTWARTGRSFTVRMTLPLEPTDTDTGAGPGTGTDAGSSATPSAAGVPS